MELLGFLLAVLAIAFVVAKLVFQRQSRADRPKALSTPEPGDDSKYSCTPEHEEPELPGSTPTVPTKRKVPRVTYQEAQKYKKAIPEDKFPSRYTSPPNEIVNDGKYRVPNYDVICGYEFSAGLTLQSPLVYLEAHGQFCPCGQVIPRIGDGHQGSLDFGGIWVTRTNSPEYRGVPKAKIWTEVDPAVVKGSAWEYDIVEFLKGFRRIVETNKGIDEIKEELLEYSSSTSHIKKVWKAYEECFQDFPDHFFYGRLKRQLGTSKTHTKVLFEAGFTSLEKFEGVTVEDLTGLKGIGTATAKKILARFADS